MTAANDEQREYWNTEGGEHWVAHAADYEHQLSEYVEPLLEGARLGGNDRVLDIGCGFGVTTLAAAGNAATALGMDISGPMIELARSRAARAGVSNASFECADVQTNEFVPGSFDVAISRFGVMFFGDPVAAFANVSRAMAPGGRLAFLCWRELFVNEWMMVPGGAALAHVPMPPFGDPEGARTVLDV